MVDSKIMCHLTILLLTFCFMLVQCSLEPTDQFLDNPTDAKQDVLTMHKRPSFFVGSRYGRSSGGASSSGGGAYAPSKTRRLNVVPRNDRFFLGSRYGKRAEISTGTQLSNKPAPLMLMNDNYSGGDNSLANVGSGSAASPYMSCIYTGLQNFYRCNSIDDNMFYVKNTVKNNAADAYNFNDDDDNSDVDDNDENGNGNADGDGDGDEDDVDDINEVLSTGATAEGMGGSIGAEALAALVNEADIRNDVNGKN